MIIEKSKITGKGQIQLPVKIRKAIGANNGDEMLFKLTDKGEITVELIKKRSLSDFAGVLPVKKPFPGIEEEEEKTRLKVAKKKGKYDERK
jgi:bifunctional DNA-binding transcriptional regulator/antitoxin component of YhaV-PrlF toxin-antitoxin module